MATNIAYSYAALVKADKNDDGTLTVYGKATDDTLDIDQQICDDSWLKNAMPEWMAAGGNVREQHSALRLVSLRNTNTSRAMGIMFVRWLLIRFR